MIAPASVNSVDPHSFFLQVPDRLTIRFFVVEIELAIDVGQLFHRCI